VCIASFRVLNATQITQIRAGTRLAAKDVFTSATGHSFVVGEGVSTDHRSNWTVRVSEDGGESWDIAEEYRGNADSTNANGGVAAEGGGLFVAGSAFDEAGLSQSWLVRRSEDGGDSWSVLDNFRLSSSGAVAYDIARSSRGSLYVVGDAKDESFARNWLVRKMACP
jgi:hypothetical protein